MGYDIRPISEINTFDFSLCSGYATKDTVRKSIDGSKFIVEGDTINAYTIEEMYIIVQGTEWNNIL